MSHSKHPTCADEPVSQDLHRPKVRSQRVAWFVAVAISSPLIWPVVAMAKSTDGAPQILKHRSSVELNKIVVTAQRYKSTLMKTPMAVSVFSPHTLKNLNITSLNNLSNYVPNLTIGRFGAGNLSDSAVFLRGIGLNDHIIFTDPSVGVYVDGIYLGRIMGANLSLLNIKRVEVMRGPQGTLYGRNTLGGAIDVITREPNPRRRSATINVSVGSRGLVRGGLYANLPLAKNLALSFEAVSSHRNGIGTDINIPNPQMGVGETNNQSGRVALLWNTTRRLSILMSADVTRDRDGQSPHIAPIISPGTLLKLTGSSIPGSVTAGAQALTPANQPSNPNNIGNTFPGNDVTTYNEAGGSLSLKYLLNDYIEFKWLNAYRESNFTAGLNDDNSNLALSVFPETGTDKQYSSELQMLGGNRTWHYISGLFWYYEHGTDTQGPYNYKPFDCATGCFAGRQTFNEAQGTHSYAAYWNVTRNFGSRWSVSGGARYSVDRKAGSALFSAWSTPARAFRNNSWHALTGAASVNYKLSENDSVYVRYSRGYQPGQYTPRPFGGPSQFVASPKTTANDYEAGFKGMITDWWNVRATVFWTDYTNLDLQEAIPSSSGFSSYVASVNARARGVELESALRRDGWHASLSAGYIDGAVTSVAASVTAITGVTAGDALAQTPKWNGTLAGGYTWNLRNGGTLDASANYSYRSFSYGQIYNTQPERISPYGLAGFNVQYDDPTGMWSVGIFGKNIFNKVYTVGAINDLFHGFTDVVLNNDRSEFGVNFTMHFR